MTIEQAIKQARERSENGYVQHVNRVTCGDICNVPFKAYYIVSDWYDNEVTVISFENGRTL